jgi:L-ascorbate metabolism protein UlaG (beta-lactamase superfamily)
MLIANVVLAQRSPPDQVAVKSGSVSVQPVLHGTVMLTWNGKTIYVDPFGGAKAFAGLAAPDLILITDIHGDHHNAETLGAIETSNAKIIVPQAVYDQLTDDLKPKAVVVGNGQTTNQIGIAITAIPMYNLPEDEESRHTKGRGNGYILNLGGKNFYFSGDTEDIPEMRNLKDIEVAFVCMNQPFTMDINQAADAVLAFKPRIVYPYHYRGQGGLADVAAFKELEKKGDAKIDVRLRTWYPEY